MSKDLKITGIMTTYNVESSHYPFIECILLALPLVDEMIVLDMGSTDDTLILLEKLSKTNKKIKIEKCKFDVDDYLSSIDRCFKETISNCIGEWIISFQVNEYFDPNDHKKLLHTIETAHKLGYNSLSFKLKNLFHWNCIGDTDFNTNKIFKKSNSIIPKEGANIFHESVDNEIKNIEPQFNSDIPLYHLRGIFEINDLMREFYYYNLTKKDIDQSRVKNYFFLKEKYGIEKDNERFNIKDIKLDKSTINNTVIKEVPQIFHSLANSSFYEVRDELFRVSEQLTEKLCKIPNVQDFQIVVQNKKNEIKIENKIEYQLIENHEELKVTGIMPVYNVISRHFPFVECILLALPLVDEMIIVDGGSTDGTLDVIEKLSEINKKIRIYKTTFKPSKDWIEIDRGFMEAMKIATGNWIIAFHADEYFHPTEYPEILRSIEVAHRMGYNSIKHSMYSIYCWDSISQHNYNPVRIFRNLPNVIAEGGIGHFYFENEPQNEIYGLSNLPPEFKSNFISHHIVDIFEAEKLVTGARHVNFFGIDSDPSRVKNYNNLKAYYGIKLDDENYDIEKINFKPILPENGVHFRVPKIFYGLIGKLKYEVREELYEIAKYLVEKGEKIPKLDNLPDYFKLDECNEELKITGIMPVHNVMSGHFPFVECISLALPLVDEMILLDGGSTDGTLDILKKLSKTNKKIKVVNIDFSPGREWSSIDNAFMETVYNHATGNWIIAFHADECFHPRDHEFIKDSIKTAHLRGFNCIRHSMFVISRWETNGDNFNWLPVRIFRKLPNIEAKAGIDFFHFKDKSVLRDNLWRSNLQPDYDISEDVSSYHIQDIYDIGDLITSKRHLEYYAIGNNDRVKTYASLKRKYNIDLEDENYDIDKIDFKPIVPQNINIHLPHVFYGLIGSTKYYVRDELYDLIKKL